MANAADDDAPTGEWDLDRPTAVASDPATEHRFVLQLLDNPDDAEVRLVYADWLEERGEALKAALVRWFAESREEPELVLVDEDLDPTWLALVSRLAIDRCAGPKLRFQCPEQWSTLEPTDDARVRFCGACERKVYFCATRADIRERARSGDCVAFSALLGRTQGQATYDEHDPELMMMGEVAAPEDWDSQGD